MARRIGTFDAVILGLGSMVGAGVFAAFAPAARAAGNALLLGLGLAAWIAYCNATSSAQLAAVYPESGGTYVYGRRLLSPFWGFLSGWCFISGKLASCAAMAITFGHYAAPGWARPLAGGAVFVLTMANYHGVQKTALLTRVLVALVLSSLIIAVVAVWFGGAADVGRLWPLGEVTATNVLEATGFLFFAFAGYARLATLGEEVIDPERTIPRAIPLALGIALAVYALVAVSVLSGTSVERIGSSSTPLAVAVEAGRFFVLSPVVRMGASVASLGVLLSLIVGVSRTIFAMASEGDLPRYFAAVHTRTRVPHRAEVAVGGIVALVAVCGDVRAAIGFSSFLVLVYYGITNAAAWSLPRARRRWSRSLSGAGMLGCGVVALALPASSVLAAAVVLLAGVAVYVARQVRRTAAS